ncbi:response regulator [Modestobacter sp. VKM Ac-2986]|uniref:response regulator n=1 Tax=Modestobacter sp. VKM Ac-2986 TaxID=3004140 RepID=UPI0022AAB0F9|nr:response regulator [Modestobacter sp. VKM Ac-2986]MCZ2828746.1 response regulator [Modestobacter sp. VKM Ac-2986]
MLTALVIDESRTARAQVTGLLELAGWGVHEAGDAEDARWLNASLAVDLVVTAATVLGAPSGAALLTELRTAGSTARFLVVTPEPTAEVRAAAAAAGALACLPAPVDARLLLDLLARRGTTPPTALVDAEDLHDADRDDELADRLQAMYDAALPGRFSAIDRGARAGDPQALADAAFTLAGTSGQLGHPDVADVCQAIAADARRGVLAHSRVSELAGLAGVDRRVADRRRAPGAVHGDRGEPRGTRDRRLDQADRRGRSVADRSTGAAMDVLEQAADAAAGRLAARRHRPAT